MAFGSYLDKILLKPYLNERAETYNQALYLALILLGLAGIIGISIPFSTSSRPELVVLLSVVASCLGIVVLIGRGKLQLATGIAVLALGSMASTTMFLRETYNNYELYVLTTIHLFVLLMATLLTYRTVYLYLSMCVGTAIIASHYFFRASPLGNPDNPANVDDLLIAIGLVLIAGIITSRIMGGRAALMRKIEDESAENRLRATELEQSQTLLNAIIDQSPIPMIIVSPEGEIVTLNKALLEYAGEADSGGLRPGTKLSDTGVNWRVFNLKDDEIPMDRMPLRKAIEGIVTPGRELRFVLPDGTAKWAIQHAAPIYDAAGNMIAGFSAFADITERKAAEEALRENEEKYRNLTQNSGEAIYLLYDRKFEIINQKFEDMFGVTLDDVNSPDFDFMNLVAPSSRAAVEERMKRFAKGEELSPSYEFVALTADGKEVQVEAAVTYVKYKDGVATQGIIRDVTERSRLEAQLRQSQKMEAVGRLAGGVAHDFNNLLTVIIGYSELLQDEGMPRVSLEHIREIQQAGESAKRLTSQLLAFSRKQITQPKVIQLNELIFEHNKMLGRLLGENIEIRTDLTAESDFVHIDPGQMEQMVMNIAVNARDAMPFGGTLKVTTENLVLTSDSPAREPECEPGEYVVLSIGDSGVGMSEAVLSRVFEPFFTTKGREKGTGLGLSTVYGIVKQNGGFIYMDSEENVGTTVRILLPAVEREKRISDGSGELKQLVGGTETILLVEDDETVREFMSSILSIQGYKVVTAENGEVALKAIEEATSPVDLVVTDVVMPMMSGRELVDRLQANKPDLKCIYVSGYTDDAIVHHGVLDEGVVLIQKPFTREVLLTKIREVIDG